MERNASTAGEGGLLPPKLNESNGVALGVAECLDLGVADTKTANLLAGGVPPLENVHDSLEELAGGAGGRIDRDVRRDEEWKNVRLCQTAVPGCCRPNGAASAV